ncbi:MAG: hypothetical protein H8E40_05215 [Chloroflexi bacterium]|nr:hypothetical protein [Chloroflexota bacterium]
MAKKEILWFEELGKEARSLAGSKNANIGEMIKLGVPVPCGFAVTTEAYDKFLAATGAGKLMEQCLAKFPKGPQTVAEYEELSRTMGQIILTTEMPNDLQNAITKAYDALCEGCEVIDLPVAVRSSGVAEDLPMTSFAGQYETFLNVRGKEDLLDKIEMCWASLFTTRAISYRILNNLPVLAGSMSVGVQKMVNARAAGVCFTIHPTTGDDTNVVLEGNWGIGESVVQGTVTPDRYIINRERLTLEEKKISRKTKQVVLRQRGTVEEDVPADKQSESCLTDEEAVKIAELAIALEFHYDTPQDIEWAVDRDFLFPKNVFLLQTRPVTAVAKKSATEQILDLMLNRLTRR